MALKELSFLFGWGGGGRFVAEHCKMIIYECYKVPTIPWRIHCENIPMQYTAIFPGCKK